MSTLFEDLKEGLEEAISYEKGQSRGNAKIYGYCRISRKEQSIDRQIRNIKSEYPSAVIVQEAYTGTRMDRPEWMKLFNRTKAGDTIVFDSVSRMSRNADEGCELYETLFNQNVTLVFLKEPHINTEVYRKALQNQIDVKLNTGNKATDEFISKIIEALNKYTIDLAKAQIRIAFEQAEKEVQDLHQRTKEGIETARLNGKQIGQKPGSVLNVKKKSPAKEVIKKHSKDFGGSLSDAECMALAKVSRNTYYKYKRELKDALEELPDDWDMHMITEARKINDGETITLQEVEDMLKSEP